MTVLTGRFFWFLFAVKAGNRTVAASNHPTVPSSLVVHSCLCTAVCLSTRRSTRRLTNFHCFRGCAPICGMPDFVTVFPSPFVSSSTPSKSAFSPSTVRGRHTSIGSRSRFHRISAPPSYRPASCSFITASGSSVWLPEEDGGAPHFARHGAKRCLYRAECYPVFRVTFWLYSEQVYAALLE